MVIDFELDVRVRYGRSAPPPPFRYAVTLELREGEEWSTVRLWDNTHSVDEHHEHGYTRSGGKQPPAVLRLESVNDAMAAAIRRATSEWRAIVNEWRASL